MNGEVHKKKIIFKVPEFPHLSETFIVAQIVTAIKLDYEVQILTRKLIGNTTTSCSKLIEEYRLLDKIIIQDYKIPSNKVLKVLKWAQILISNLTEIRFILKYHKEQSRFSLSWLFEWFFYKGFNDAAIFHVQYGTNSNPLPILKKVGFKPALIVTFHGHDAFFPINGYIQNNGYYNNLFKYGNQITANTPYLAEKVIDLGCLKEKLEIIPVGVDTDFFYPSNDNKNRSNTLKLVTVGRLDKVKGHSYCIKVLSQLIDKGIDATLTIIGEGTEFATLEKLIVEYHLGNKVFLLGKKSQEEVRQILWEHDVYLLLAVPVEDGRRETQGLATLEAQACGLPVIVFNSGGIKYTLANEVSGFVCNEFDVNAVVTNIIKFIETPILLQEMSNQAIIFANENFSQKIIDKKWRTIYKNVS